MLLAVLLAVATLTPVGPWVGWKYDAPAEVEGLLEFELVTSKSSVMPVGADIEPLALFPNSPSTSEPFKPVVSDGAEIMRVLAV